MRREWSVYLIDQPRRGRAGRTAQPVAATPLTDSFYWNFFRFGTWQPPAEKTFFPGIQFPTNEEAVEQMLRQATPNTGEEAFPSIEERNFLAKTVSELFTKINAGILLTHSHSGQYGWATAMEVPERVKAVVAYEPAGFPFPDTGVPEDIPSEVAIVNEQTAPQLYPLEDFLNLTKMPILIVFGDNIKENETISYPDEFWRVLRNRAYQFVDAVNRHGGDAQVVELPQIGITGNTHFMFADLNNIDIANHLSNFLNEKSLDIIE